MWEGWNAFDDCRSDFRSWSNWWQCMHKWRVEYYGRERVLFEVRSIAAVSWRVSEVPPPASAVGATVEAPQPMGGDGGGLGGDGGGAQLASYKLAGPPKLATQGA